MAAGRQGKGSYTVSLANRKARGSGHERLGEILAAAKDLFVEHGVENVSTRKIAERVGISQTALFTYYRTKDEILARLMADAFAELRRAVGALEGEVSGTEEWLRRGIAGYIAFGLRHPDEYRLAFMVMKPRDRAGEGSLAPSSGHEVGFPVFMALEQRIEAGMAEGVIRRDLGPPMLVTQAFWAAIHGLVALLIARPRPHFPWEDVDALVRTQTEILLGGLLVPKDR